ncbi:MAG TPA: NAD(P)/FAD-dependent oxidoreductase [Pyrinomonadaceae bacterium]|nr:NAD(P)/FAD-dependent oxidoreductase [Pyrinomonadaceae bacterium]
MSRYDVTIIGGGHNGLVTACYLAKSGLKTLVLEQREVVGGGAVTEEIAPRFRVSTLDHVAGPFSAAVAADLKLAKFGLEMIVPQARVLALGTDGRPLCIYEDVGRTVEEIEKFSQNDAQNYPEFVNSFARIGRVLAPLVSMTPPAIDRPGAGDVWELGKVGLAFRKLGKKDEYRLLRWGPMAIADLVSEWFETELLRAVVAARGIYGAFAGPWSAGTSLGLLWQAAMDGSAIGSATHAKGGMGALSTALADAAKAAGAEIRTRAAVASIVGADTDAPKVVLESGEEIDSRVVVSNADPRTTFLDLVDPVDLDPNFLSRMRNYRTPGTVAKLNLALDALPAFRGLNGDNPRTKLSGRIHIGPEIDYLERAFDASKYGDFSSEPYLDITIPSLGDPSLAPEGKHVMSIHVQFAPYKLKQGHWTSRREEFAENVLSLLERYAPGVRESIVAAQVITPQDLEQTYGLSGGHIHHGEQSLDQFFTFRPLIGWAQYRTPLKRLYLCGAGTHPGGGLTGLNGANAAREIARDLKASRK